MNYPAPKGDWVFWRKYYKIIFTDETLVNEFIQKCNIIETEASEAGYTLYIVTLK